MNFQPNHYPKSQLPLFFDDNYEASTINVRSRAFELYKKTFGELIDRENINGRRVLEIGGGGSDFLQYAAMQGAKSVLGIDPIFHNGVQKELIDRSSQIVADFSERVKILIKEIRSGNATKNDLKILRDKRQKFLNEAHYPLLSWANDFEKNPLRYHPRSLPDTQLAENSFDLVVSHWCFPFHFRETQTSCPALEEIIRITAPGGKIILFPILEGDLEFFGDKNLVLWLYDRKCNVKYYDQADILEGYEMRTMIISLWPDEK